jgi:epoxyqueuosine reductase
MKAEVQAAARELGFSDCRITTAEPPASVPYFLEWLKRGEHGRMGYLERNAHKRVESRLVLPGARSVICLATAYRPPGSQSGPGNAGAGIVAAYARAADYHDILGEQLRTLTARVDSLGGPGTRSLWYVDTGPVLERDLAQRAGLGFIGKHTSLINRTLGNWIFLSEILTTAVFEPDPPERNRCGTCVRCLEACPTAAIRAPFQLDARRCISYLTIELREAIPVELRAAIGTRIFGCDDCLAVCPWNRFAGAASELMRRVERPELGRLELCGLLALSEAEFKKKFAGTPLERSKRRGLLRNVCVALGNLADPAALPALEAAAQDPEPLIAEHARWAIGRIQQRMHGRPD